ncbi:zf-TFIIB domain-containing protein [Actinocorallia longicatena]|uniref:Zf-TFIIB domain-containing protein n=1 Tax=Actinocorallia longicatena TaxID=111803 RepID=A0ABP6QF45_9ACTN
MLQCPKCRGTMRTFDRNGVHIEQCEMCRGIFLDYGELETLARVESQWRQAPPPPPVAQPGWGAGHHAPVVHHHHGRHGHHGSLFGMLFST